MLPMIIHMLHCRGIGRILAMITPGFRMGRTAAAEIWQALIMTTVILPYIQITRL